MQRPFSILIVAAFSMFVAACSKEDSKPDSKANATLRIAVVPKGTSHDYWKSVHAGALRAAQADASISLTFRGPEREDDRDQQISLLQNLVSSKYDGIVLAPLDNVALVGPVRQAREAGIPVVIIDSGIQGVPGTDFVSFVATDNREGGRMGGKLLGERLAGKGKVLLLRYMEGSASTTEREEGFLEAIRSFESISVIDPGQFAGATRATAQESAENLLTKHADIDGVFCPNESSTFGMLLALRSKALNGKVRFVGFDASDAAVEALRKNEIDGLVLQNPIRMGELGVTTLINHIRGKQQDSRIDTGVAVVTPANIDEPAMKSLIAPDLDTLLEIK
jgi:ribose transport system substrate-binding protein